MRSQGFTSGCPGHTRSMGGTGAFQCCLSWFGKSWLLSLSSVVGGFQRVIRRTTIRSHVGFLLSPVASLDAQSMTHGWELWSLSVPCWVCVQCQLSPDAKSELSAAGHESWTMYACSCNIGHCHSHSKWNKLWIHCTQRIIWFRGEPAQSWNVCFNSETSVLIQ